MKQHMLYVLTFLLFGCKIGKKTTSKNLVNIVVVDSVKEVKLQELQKSLKEILIGTIYRKTYEISEFKGLSSGGHLIGNYKNGYKFKGKSYSLITIESDYEIVKYIIFDVVRSKRFFGN